MRYQVGGEQLEAALACLNDFGRVVACGMISQYNKAPEDRYGIKNLLEVVFKRIKIQGFIVSHSCHLNTLLSMIC